MGKPGPVLVKEKEFIYSNAIVILIVNIGIALIPVLIRSTKFHKYAKLPPIIIFLFEALFYLDPTSHQMSGSKISYTGSIYCLSFIAFFTILDQFLPETSGYSKVENSSDDEGEIKENELSDFRLLKFVFVALMWCTYLIEGIYSYHLYYSYGLYTYINLIFYNVFRYGTIQFAYGVYIMAECPPSWLYYVLMIPQAILYSLGALLSYHIHKADESRLTDAMEITQSFMSGALIYCAFEMICLFMKKSVDDDSNERSFKHFLLIVSFFYCSLITQINRWVL